jgi:hypothetical protein
MANNHLPDSKLEELRKEFDRIETDKIGPGRHEAFHKMIDTMKGVYLQ